MRRRKKPEVPMWILISIILIWVGYGPIYTYFSTDVDRLNNEYPYEKVLPDFEVEVELKPRTPENWVQLKDISRHAQWAIILSEDFAFYQHQGVNLEQIWAALKYIVEGERVREASTITQQMVKNMYLSNSRNVSRKLEEVVLSYKVEKALSKEKILEIYLNFIEYGPKIFGIKAAAHHYFKKSPSEINPKEAAFLAMLLPNPRSYYVSFEQRRLTAFAQSRISEILKKMKMAKNISDEEYKLELLRPLSWEKK